ncbi:MAG: hypothetical protein MZU95_07450 [Desulfomicrobium escambiense]|nr:hypothetical protein [Desulfomicrobium escambiense]
MPSESRASGRPDASGAGGRRPLRDAAGRGRDLAALRSDARRGIVFHLLHSAFPAGLRAEVERSLQAAAEAAGAHRVDRAGHRPPERPAAGARLHEPADLRAPADTRAAAGRGRQGALPRRRHGGAGGPGRTVGDRPRRSLAGGGARPHRPCRRAGQRAGQPPGAGHRGGRAVLQLRPAADGPGPMAHAGHRTARRRLPADAPRPHPDGRPGRPERLAARRLARAAVPLELADAAAHASPAAGGLLVAGLVRAQSIDALQHLGEAVVHRAGGELEDRTTSSSRRWTAPPGPAGARAGVARSLGARQARSARRAAAAAAGAGAAPAPARSSGTGLDPSPAPPGWSRESSFRCRAAAARR